MIAGLDVVALVRCPVCEEWKETDGEDGLIPHLLFGHPWSAQAIFIRKQMEEPVV